MARDWRKARRPARGSWLKEELQLALGPPGGQGSETGTSENGTKRQQLSYPCHKYGKQEQKIGGMQHKRRLTGRGA